MSLLLNLWLPILLSGAVVFVASALAWMALPHHKAEWTGLADPEGFRQALRELNIRPGQYMFPYAATSAEMRSEQHLQRVQEGPRGVLAVWAQAPKMGVNMVWTFLFYVATSFMIAYLSTIALAPGDAFLAVFRFVGTAGILAYCCAGVPNAIWFKRPILTDVLDGVVFGLLTGLVFALLWPGA